MVLPLSSLIFLNLNPLYPAVQVRYQFTFVFTVSVPKLLVAWTYNLGYIQIPSYIQIKLETQPMVSLYLLSTLNLFCITHLQLYFFGMKQFT